jgi:hypothetical protein
MAHWEEPAHRGRRRRSAVLDDWEVGVVFVQIMQGRTRDLGLLQQRMDEWAEQIRPGAVGFLGSTGGMTPDGEAFVAARFESPDAARRNSDRAEQSAWWERASAAFDGDVTFHDCSTVDLMATGGSDEAGFVQVMQGRAVDPQKLREIGEAMMPEIQARRPEIVGGFVAWHDDDPNAFTQVVYFRSEEAARAGEQGMDESETSQWMELLEGPVTFRDLSHPMLL